MLIDAHAHYLGDHPRTLEWMSEHKAKVLNICVAHEHGDGWRERGEAYRRLAAKHPDKFAWCTTFSLPDYTEDDYAEKVIEGLKTDIANGAIACKVWKVIGMVLREPDGKFAQIDNAIFTPIFEFLGQVKLPVIMHLAEPLECWRPLDENNSMVNYYTNNPQYHMYGKDDYPHHREIMAARDNVVARHQNVSFVGAHLACLEYDVKELAARFDKFDNFVVDTSGPARIVSLGRQDRDEVREFFIKYADRIMYGSDRSTKDGPQTEMNEQELEESFAQLVDTFQMGQDYYGTDKEMTLKGFTFGGLDLPDDVMEKLFCTNAQRCFPGL